MGLEKYFIGIESCYILTVIYKFGKYVGIYICINNPVYMYMTIFDLWFESTNLSLNYYATFSIKSKND